ncbi:hypothetical protein VIGAN_03119900 [Vigna angularis var. angularis]|uniref:Uncharacterized protein n=1 Tax=Vigna angularis var. angularis TaxID=157739 RepID=A0A0S3RLM7_PHAAN|nr:hypothetical protein VIGAN_03119900 [Vigna angularis var. angularis]
MVVGAFLKPLPPKTPFYGLRLNWARVSPLAPIFFATTKHFHFFRNKHFVDGSINLKTCKNCKTQFDLSLNHPLACRFHTAHFEGTHFVSHLLHVYLSLYVYECEPEIVS